MNLKRKEILYEHAKKLHIPIELRVRAVSNELIRVFGSFDSEDYKLFIKYVEYEQAKQTET